MRPNIADHVRTFTDLTVDLQEAAARRAKDGGDPVHAALATAWLLGDHIVRWKLARAFSSELLHYHDIADPERDEAGLLKV